MPRLAAIVVNYNGGPLLAGTLRSLGPAGVPMEKVVLVDNASTDGSHLEAARAFPALTLIETPEVSFAAANNLALRRLAADPPDIVLFVNNDARLEPGCAFTLEAALEDDPALGAAAPLILDPRGLVWYAGGEIAWREAGAVFPGRGEPPGRLRSSRVEFATLCVLAVRWRALAAAGLLDETYRFYDEDLEFCLRLAAGGFGLAFEPRARAVHEVGYSTSQRGPAFVYRNMARNRLMTMRRHGTPGRRLAFYPWFGAMMAKKALVFALKGRADAAAAIFGGVKEGLGDPFLPLPRLAAGKLRILWLHQGAEMYGSDRVLLNLVSRLAGRGHANLVVLPEDGPLAASLREAGAGVRLMRVPVARRREMRGLGAARFLLSLPGSVRRFGRAARGFDPDVVCTNTGTMMTGALWCRRRAKPHVWLIHEIYPGGGRGARLFARTVLGWSTGVVVPSEAVAAGLRRESAAGTVTVIPNGIEPKPLSADGAAFRARLGLPSGAVLAGVAGRFNRWKGQREMTGAMALVAAGDPTVHFAFAGAPFRGDEAIVEEFRRCVAAAGLERKVHLLGELADMGPFYAAIDFLVHPAVAPEPFGLVILEALAAGKPVAAFAHGGPAEILDRACGLLVPPGDQEALARAILELAADQGRREAMGRAGAARVVRLYSLEAQAEAFERLLLEVAR